MRRLPIPVEWSVGAQVEYPHVAYPELVLGQARRRPDAVAVRQGPQVLTYRELVADAAALAGALRERGVGPEDRVGICVRRRPGMVTAMFGVLLSGAAYVPVDPEWPGVRRRQVLADAATRLVVVDPETAGLLGEGGSGNGDGSHGGEGAAPAPVLLPVPSGSPAGRPVPACPAAPENAAYVIYTSGSTGRPKGVVITHRSLVAYAVGFGAATGVTEQTRSFGFASPTFDVSVMDILVPLAAGGEVELLSEDDRADPARLQAFVAEHRVSWGCVPVALLPLLDPDQLPEWRLVVTGAEAPGPEQVLRWAGPAQAPRRRFLNCYGPTEATVCVTGFEAAGAWDRPLPMGGPLPNHRAYVVDEQLRPVPPGVPGELLLGGAGLARGYLGSPALTAQRFIPDPFGEEPGGRLYRTGDHALWLPDGALLFLGRADGQVKIRGQRVEIGEVETALRLHPQVAHAVVATVPGPHGLTLVAFCTPQDAPDTEAVQEWCAKRLPAAMVPARVVRLARLPLNTSGKVDVAALRMLATSGPDGPGAPAAGPHPAAGPDRVAEPGTVGESGTVGERGTVGEPGAVDEPGTATEPVERRVARVWAQVLDVPADLVRPDDDFFVAGGHSISAMRLVAGLRAQLRRAVSVEDVFSARTLRVVVERVLSAPPLEGGDLPSGSPLALSAAQRRLWFVDKLDLQAAAYNVAVAERLLGPLDVPALDAALAAVAARHDVLRWRVPDTDGRPYVEMGPASHTADLPVTDLSTMDEPARDIALREWLTREAASRFDLATGPLWRARLLRLAADDHVLAVTFHHAVFDGWSQRPYLADLGRAYAAARDGRPAQLPELTTRFADYVAWRAARDDGRGVGDLAWWRQHLAGAPWVLDLPRDRPRPAVQTYRGEQVSDALSVPTSRAVREIAAGSAATAPSALLAAFTHLVGRITGAAEVVVGTPAADRRHAAFHDLVGFFIDVVPLRVRLAPGTSYQDQVRACADEVLEVLSHPAAPLERIVEALGVPRDATRSPVVQVLFNVYNFPEPQLRLPGVRVRPATAGLPGSAFDLTVYLFERDGAFAVEFTYNPDLFDRDRMRALLTAYIRLLDQCCADPAAPLSAFELPGLARLSQPGAAAAAAPSRAPAGGPVAPGPLPAGGSVLPATPTERTVARIWCDVLGRDSVGAVENFFDIGGTSMAAVVVQTRLAAALGREIRVVDLFRYPSVRALAGYLDGGAAVPELDRAAARAALRRDRGRSRASGRYGGGGSQ
ncbi:MAG TPA: amino acid adenylation domain-containing protein [Micromonosporaceae bacterium]|nr:amino acid adenylation domain-containing protein [Micromonosporaceae bacterium]